MKVTTVDGVTLYVKLDKVEFVSGAEELCYCFIGFESGEVVKIVGAPKTIALEMGIIQEENDGI